MELAAYIACICEGSAENAVIDILLDHHLLIFEREDLIEEKVIDRQRCIDSFAAQYQKEKDLILFLQRNRINVMNSGITFRKSEGARQQLNGIAYWIF